jgi:hypothetical protein
VAVRLGSSSSQASDPEFARDCNWPTLSSPSMQAFLPCLLYPPSLTYETAASARVSGLKLISRQQLAAFSTDHLILLTFRSNAANVERTDHANGHPYHPQIGTKARVARPVEPASLDSKWATPLPRLHKKVVRKPPRQGHSRQEVGKPNTREEGQPRPSSSRTRRTRLWSHPVREQRLARAARQAREWPSHNRYCLREASEKTNRRCQRTQRPSGSHSLISPSAPNATKEIRG